MELTIDIMSDKWPAFIPLDSFVNSISSLII